MRSHRGRIHQYSPEVIESNANKLVQLTRGASPRSRDLLQINDEFLEYYGLPTRILLLSVKGKILPECGTINAADGVPSEAAFFRESKAKFTAILRALHSTSTDIQTVKAPNLTTVQKELRILSRHNHHQQHGQKRQGNTESKRVM